MYFTGKVVRDGRVVLAAVEGQVREQAGLTAVSGHFTPAPPGRVWPNMDCTLQFNDGRSVVIVVERLDAAEGVAYFRSAGK